MNVRVLLFALAKESYGDSSIEIELPAGATIGDLRSRLATKIPAISPLIGHSSFAADGEVVGDKIPIVEGVEVACILPVSGG